MEAYCKDQEIQEAYIKVEKFSFTKYMSHCCVSESVTVVMVCLIWSWQRYISFFGV